jgi:hypothetical protein
VIGIFVRLLLCWPEAVACLTIATAVIHAVLIANLLTRIAASIVAPVLGTVSAASVGAPLVSPIAVSISSIAGAIGLIVSSLIGGAVTIVVEASAVTALAVARPVFLPIPHSLLVRRAARLVVIGRVLILAAVAVAIAILSCGVHHANGAAAYGQSNGPQQVFLQSFHLSPPLKKGPAVWTSDRSGMRPEGSSQD